MKIYNFFAVSAFALSASVSFADNANDRYLYIGTELGFSDPVVKSFEHKNIHGDKTKIRLKRSEMYGGRIGYSFYPGMSIEISATHQPKYRLSYTLPEKKIFNGAFTIPETLGGTNVSSNVYTLNFVYTMQEQFLKIRPYVIFGAGVARISIKPTISTTDVIPGTDIGYFRINKNNQNYFAWQAGAGLSRDIGDNFSIDVGAKLQVVNDVKIKYDVLNVTKQTFEVQKPVKQTIGVGEFTLGLTFKLPV